VRSKDVEQGDIRDQQKWLLILVVLYALAGAVYILMPGGGLAMTDAFEGATLDVPAWQLVLANAVLILILYGGLGLVGLWLAARADLPGVYRPGAGLRDLLWRPMRVGLFAGAVLVGADTVVRLVSDFEGFPHPSFPASLLASFSAGVGEEILFRLFVMSLWTVALGWVFSRFAAEEGARLWALRAANVLAALAFAAAHLGTATVVADALTPLGLPPMMLAEIIVLNGFVGVLAGASFARNGLIAAAGVHFWTDVVWHVIFGALSGGASMG
jgi:hypothetical protein